MRGVSGVRRAQRAQGAPGLDALLCREVAALAASARADPRLLARPVRIVVPSNSLRLHVASLLVRQLGGGLLGVVVQTLDTLARSIAEPGAEGPPLQAAYPLLVRRHARAEPALAQHLDPLVDGYGAVVASIDDLLDAGFEAAHGEALEACLGACGVSGAEADRAFALLRVAARTARALDAGAIDHGSRALVRARLRLEAEPDRALPARAVFVHGFADATGVQADLIETLVRLRDARVLLAPAAPLAPGDPEGLYGARFRERVAAACGGIEARDLPAPAAARFTWIEAPGPHAEVRAVALRLRRLLDGGACPERIGIVARELAPFALPLRLHLARLGVPWSGIAATGPVGSAGRRLAALLALIERGARASAELWLDAVSRFAPAPPARGEPWSPTRVERADLREALHKLGAAQLADVAALDLPGRDVSLRARRGFEPAAAGEPLRAVRRTLSASALARACRAAASLRDRWQGWPQVAPLAAHLARLRDLVDTDLGWRTDCPGRDDLERVLLAEDAPLPLALEMDREEFLLLVRRALEDCGRAPLGGQGGGVQVLSVMEARARSFDALFVIGMNRGVFPRSIVEDPLLADDVRRALRDVLPELPVKRDAVDEERELFAQLAASSGEVTFSWHAADEDGRACAPSPLVERLLGAGNLGAVELAPPVVSPWSCGAVDDALRPAQEHALRIGPSGAVQAFEAALSLAFEALPAPALDRASAEALARGRCAVLRELDAPAAQRAAPGPYLGLVGALRGPTDPRRAALFVTTLERTARCPWQAFVMRLLRVEPSPDALGALPSGADPLAVGNVVHAVLETIAAGTARAERAADAALEARPIQPARWPSHAELERILADCAAREVRERGIALAGYARALALRARAYLEVARACDWQSAADGVPVVGAEVVESVTVADGSGSARTLCFKADRVDRVGSALRFTDYKTGRPLVEQVRAAARAAALHRQVARGEALQAVAYALRGGAAAQGRYVFLRPELRAEVRVLEVTSDPEWQAPFARAVGTLLEAWDRGSFVPRLALPGERGEEPQACRSCEVREACLRGDSGARARLLAWLERVASEPDRAPIERSALAIWNLARAES